MKKVLEVNSSTNQAIKGKFVQREVLQCMTGLVEKLLEKDIVSIDEIENLYSEENQDEPQDVLEWWLVSEYLYKKLQELGEPVLSYDNFNYFWGRTCSGQAILLDSTISSICSQMEILDGQKYEWKV